MKTLDTNRSFGIEFEFTRRSCCPASLGEAIQYAIPEARIRFADWEHTPHNNPDWVVKRDGSCGWEVCTPAIRDYESGRRMLISVLDAFRKVGARVGPRTGTHIHYGVEYASPEQVSSLLAHWIKSEGLIFFSLPRGRRGNSFCSTLSQAGRIRSGVHYSRQDLIDLCAGSRYRALNIQPWTNGYPRIEIRVVEGTLNEHTLLAWLDFFFHFLSRSFDTVQPKNLKWFGVEECFDWLWWADREPLCPRLKELRVWWLKRILKFGSVRSRRSRHRDDAKELLASLVGD